MGGFKDGPVERARREQRAGAEVRLSVHISSWLCAFMYGVLTSCVGGEKRLNCGLSLVERSNEGSKGETSQGWAASLLRTYLIHGTVQNSQESDSVLPRTKLYQ